MGRVWDQCYPRHWGLHLVMDHRYFCVSTLQMLFTYPQRSQCEYFFRLLLRMLMAMLIFRSAGMYMQEALELVCRRRKLTNPNEYALLLADKSIIIPLDRTVASLQGKRELLLMKRSMLPQMGAVALKGMGKTTDPNGLQSSLHHV